MTDNTAQTLYIDGKPVAGVTGYGYDGCHKFYLVTSPEGHAQLESFGYEIETDLGLLPGDWRGACPLRFISPAMFDAPDYIPQDRDGTVEYR